MLRSISIRRPSASMIVSMVALFAALGGTSYAAVKITGKDIAKKTITYKNLKDETVGPSKIKPESLTGEQINEGTLGPVPKAALADAATNAGTLDGIDSTGFMQSKQRAYEVNEGSISNFGSGAPLETLADLPGGTYVVTAKLTYDNDGATAAESCTLNVPGADDTTSFVVADTEMVMLQEVTESAGAFSLYVSCTGDGNDDTYGNLSIIANRVD